MSLLERAKFGDREAFDALVAPERPRMIAIVRRMVGHPEDTEEVVQDSLLRAYEKIGTFRGESAFGTWLVSIATRAAIDHLRARKRWSWDASTVAHLASPEHRFDAIEHIAFCFTCVARSLEPESEAALILTDVFEYSGREAARILGVTESVYRHRLADARKTMTARFEGLCGLVAKTGVCYQCEGLRDHARPEARGRPIPVVKDYASRLPIVREGDVVGGASQRFHDFVWRALRDQAEATYDVH